MRARTRPAATEPIDVTAVNRLAAVVLLLDLDEVARALGVGKRMAETLVASGEVRSVKLGRCRRVAVRDLEAYVDRLREAAVG